MNAPSLLRKFAGLLIAIGAAAFLTTPAHAGDGTIALSWFNGERVTGSGKAASETRTVSGFQGIALRGSMKLVLRQGTREGLELRGDDNLLPLIESRVVERSGVPTLEIGVKKGVSMSPKSEVVATIDLITLRALSISGSGDVTAEALKTSALAVAITGSGNVRLKQLVADSVSAKVTGSGDIEFSGRAPKLEVSISGSGDVQARGLEADDVSVSVAGSGDANVTARKTLAVSIAGVGNVKYAGDAVVKTSIAGHGEVTRQ
jgi:Putative auto-transporter adhesin, head GIN domain